MSESELLQLRLNARKRAEEHLTLENRESLLMNFLKRHCEILLKRILKYNE